MKNLYVTLFSAFLLSGMVCASCVDKKTDSSEEVILADESSGTRPFFLGQCCLSYRKYGSLFPDKEAGIFRVFERLG